MDQKELELLALRHLGRSARSLKHCQRRLEGKRLVSLRATFRSSMRRRPIERLSEFLVLTVVSPRISLSRFDHKPSDNVPLLLLRKKTTPNRILGRNEPRLSVSGKRLKAARVPGAQKMNIADVLNKSGELADTNGLAGTRRLWNLTTSGREHVRTLVGLPANEPEIEHDVATLTTLVSKVSDEDVRSYLEEALKCLQVDALRACVVFVWTAAARSIQVKVLSKGTAAVTRRCRRSTTRRRVRSRR